jgi:hypothetical protein
MFPAGAPGVALLILRNCIAVALAGCAFPVGWQHSMFLILLSMLCIGLLTPAICGVSALAVLFELGYSREIPNAQVALVVLSTVSLAFLGPGAFSVDARLFARRILVSTSSTDGTGEDHGA